MSSEWTVIESNNRKSKVIEVPAIPQYQPQVRRSKEDERREKWEKTRQQKIDRYNAEFPLLPGSKDLIPDAQKIAYIDTKIAAEKEASHKAYLEREARRQAKRERDEKKAAIREQHHVENMIKKWGSHRWYNMVYYTDDDCDTARKLRYEEEEEEYRRDAMRDEWMARMEEEDKKREIEREKYIAEQTANMSKQQKQRWLLDLEEEEMDELEEGAYREGEIMYEAFLTSERRRIEDKKRLDAWNAKHGKK